jgi:hypothetical protein
MVYEVINHAHDVVQVAIPAQLNMLSYVCSVWVARKPPGFAFIEFDDPRDADDAIRELDGKNRCLPAFPFPCLVLFLWPHAVGPACAILQSQKYCMIELELAF